MRLGKSVLIKLPSVALPVSCFLGRIYISKKTIILSGKVFVKWCHRQITQCTCRKTVLPRVVNLMHNLRYKSSYQYHIRIYFYQIVLFRTRAWGRNFCFSRFSRISGWHSWTEGIYSVLLLHGLNSLKDPNIDGLLNVHVSIRNSMFEAESVSIRKINQYMLWIW